MVQSNTVLRRASAVSSALRKATSRLEKKSILLPKLPGKFAVGIAESRENLQKVFELAYEVYLEKGYAFHHDTKMETSPCDAHKDTLILMVENDKKEIVGSMSLYYDDGALLPADNIFHEELNLLRKQGKKLVEVSRLVIKQDYQHQREILLNLINTIYIHTFRLMNFDEFIIEVNPRHVDYYKKLLGFSQFGEIKECPRVNNAPAVLLRCSSEKYLKVVDNGEYEKRTLYNSFMPKKNETEVIKMLRAKKSISLEDKVCFNI